MEHITIYNGMGEAILVVLGTVLSSRWHSNDWELATIKISTGETLFNQYIQAASKAKIAAE